MEELLFSPPSSQRLLYVRTTKTSATMCLHEEDAKIVLNGEWGGGIGKGGIVGGSGGRAGRGGSDGCGGLCGPIGGGLNAGGMMLITSRASKSTMTKTIDPKRMRHENMPHCR
jgi:hypothetical protein